MVPESPSVFREVRNLVNKLSGRKPIIVHCSAGVGRSGTYIAIEMAYQKLKKAENMDVLSVAKHIREQRLGAVQTDLQYLFIFRMLIELLIADRAVEKSAEIRQFLVAYDELINRKKANKKV
ncbi:hypothetical protein AB6A40_010120 [Gnathostoma spinigerum]|uniref:Protein tyrosine phosphatase n=1 Tax=Gnathostoma spinigerum TaxID=75299 RepID=A0ABD6F0H9_9BILA